jgi:hypothetical protein
VTRATATEVDPFAAARRVADAVLYEGYVLYPYRASSGKNRNRWQFGVLVPPSATDHGAWGDAATGKGDSGGSAAYTEFLVDGAAADLRVLVRLLQVQARVVEVPADDGTWRAVASTTVDGRAWTSWDEAVEHEADLGWISLEALRSEGKRVPLELGARLDVEALLDASGVVAGRLVRRCEALSGEVRVGAAMCEPPCPLVRLRIDIANDTPWDAPGAGGWDETTRHALVAVHVLVAARGGRFVSLMDPPEFAREAAGACANRGLYPVLAGEAGAEDLVLASPIILYDHPELAPESEGDYFDATEIDEILTLRVLTLTDEEKAEARATDPRAAAIIDRCEDMPEDVFSRLHGAIRTLRPVPAQEAISTRGTMGPGGPDGSALAWWDPGVDAGFDPRTDVVLVDGTVIGTGSKVRLAPSRRADAQDMFVAGCCATVTGVFNDVDGEVHLAVVVDDDPAAEMHEWYGRYLYFRPDEVVVVDDGAAR